MLTYSLLSRSFSGLTSMISTGMGGMPPGGCSPAASDRRLQPAAIVPIASASHTRRMGSSCARAPRCQSGLAPRGQLPANTAVTSVGESTRFQMRTSSSWPLK
jgi:hypothetical protein